MNRLARATAILTLVAVVFHGSLPTFAAGEATIEGTVETPCDPSRVSDVASVQLRSLSGGPPASVAVDPTTGKFTVPGLAEGEYELVAIGLDGSPLSPEPMKMTLQSGSNPLVLKMQPPGCGEEEAQDKKKRGLKDWQLTLIFLGVVGVIILALDDDDDEAPASPF